MALVRLKWEVIMTLRWAFLLAAFFWLVPAGRAADLDHVGRTIRLPQSFDVVDVVPERSELQPLIPAGCLPYPVGS